MQPDPHPGTAVATRPPPPVWAFASVAISVVVVGDQVSKALAISRLVDGPTEGPGPLWFQLVANRGALMGFPLPTWLLVGVAMVVVVVAASTLRTGSRPAGLGFGLLAGGAAGNLIDRFQHRPRFPDHAVVDWIASASLPTFNLADVAIVAGLAVLALATTTTRSIRSA